MLPFAAAGVLPWFERLFLFLQVGDGIDHCKPCYLLRIADFGLRIMRSAILWPKRQLVPARIVTQV